MMPAAGHLEHMPAHILQRVGRYEEAAEANRKGAAADLAYLKETAPPDYYPMYLIHNFQFLASSAGMEGRRAETIAALKDARAHIPDELLFGMPGLDWSASFIYDGYTKFGMWDEMLKEPAPEPEVAGRHDQLSAVAGNGARSNRQDRRGEGRAREVRAADRRGARRCDAGK